MVVVSDVHTREPVRTVFGLSDTCKDPPPAYMEPQEKVGLSTMSRDT